MESFVSLALSTLTKYKITPEAMIIEMLNSNSRNVQIYDGITYSVQGHVNIHLLAQTETMEKAISIHWISDH